MKNVRKSAICIILVLALVATSAVLLTACDEPETPVIETTFALDMAETSVWPDMYLSIPGGGSMQVEKLIKKLINEDTSGIILRSDGTMTLRLMIKGSTTLQLFLPALGSMNIPQLIEDSGFVDTYLKPIVPDFDINDILGSLDKCGKSLGISFIGLDPNDANVQAIMDFITKGTPLPDEFTVPALGIEVNYNYCIRTVTNAEGNEYDAVYLTPYDSDTQPYITMTMTENEDGGHKLELLVDFIKLKLIANEKVAETETAA